MGAERKTAEQRMKAAHGEILFLAEQLDDMRGCQALGLSDPGDGTGDEMRALAEGIVTQAEAIRDAVEDLVRDVR